MADYTPRRVRERRAYVLVLTGGGAGVVAVAGFLLAVIGVISLGIPLLAAIVAVICFVLVRRTVSR
jgi:Zn-dependent membrane protease YugP